MQRAIVSVSSNVAESTSRPGNKKSKSFLSDSLCKFDGSYMSTYILLGFRIHK